MPKQLDLDSFPVDPADVCEAAATLIGDDDEHLGNVVLILGQLDPLTVGQDGQPLYTADQQTLIVRASSAVKEWHDS